MRLTSPVVRVLILHNPRAGPRRRRIPKAELMRAFARVGHTARYRSLRKSGWKRELSRPGDVVVAVGGDGTVAKVAIALAKSRSRTPLTVIPGGTANNIARGLGINGTAAALAASLQHAPRIQLAVGVARGTWGNTWFVESAGISPIASLLTAEPDTPRGALARLRVEFARAVPRRMRVRVDGVDRSGEYVMVQALNIGAIGPRVELAPDADPSDDRLNLVLVSRDQIAAIDRYLSRLALGKPARCPIRSIPSRRLEIAPWPADDGGHVDDRPWPRKSRPREGRVALSVQTQITVLVP